MTTATKKSREDMVLRHVGILEFINQGDLEPLAQDLLQISAFGSIKSGRQAQDEIVKAHLPPFQQDPAHLASDLLCQVQSQVQNKTFTTLSKIFQRFFRQGKIGKKGLFFRLTTKLIAV